ncbi:MAG TPA: hypothetical protein VF260_00240 [Bacilli bacterium]
MEYAYPKKTIIAIVCVLVLLTLVFGAATLALFRHTSKQADIIEYQNRKLNKLEQSNDLLTKVTWINVLQHEIERYVKTRHFIVEKITFGGDTFSGKLSAMIDIAMLPDSADIYQGETRFAMSRVEETTELQVLLERIAAVYDAFKVNNPQFPEWATGEFTFRIGGYTIGGVSRGQLALAE